MLAYIALRNLFGKSMQRSGLYVDALSEPFEFAHAIATRAPVLIGDLLFALRAEYWTFGAPFVASFLDDGWIAATRLRDPSIWRQLQFTIGVLACGLVAWMAYAQRRHRCPNVRWLLLGALLSVVPVCGSFPSSRLTLAACIGFIPLVASIVVRTVGSLSEGFRPRALIGAALFSYQVIVPSVQQRDEAVMFELVSREVKNMLVNLPVEEEGFGSRDMVVLTAVDGGISAYLPLTRHRFAQSVPRSCWTLSHVPAEYTLTRTQPNVFTISFQGDHSTLSSLAEQLLRDPSHHFHAGDVVNAGAMRVTVLETLEGRPRAIEVSFDRSIDDPSLMFFYPTFEGYKRFRMPAVGESVVVPAPGATSLSDELIAQGQ